jgi:hypothetical protein
MGLNIDGHLGTSVLTDILDVPLPHAIMIDYLHVTLLRHTKTMIQELYSRLKPCQREQVDVRLNQQTFPHFFNRRMRPLKDLSFVKATELRNILFYALIPIFLEYFPINRMAHICLYVCSVRLIHNEALLGEKTGESLVGYWSGIMLTMSSSIRVFRTSFFIYILISDSITITLVH